MDSLPVLKWPLHSKKAIDTDAQKVEEGGGKTDLLNARERLAGGRAKRPHLPLERESHERHDEADQDVRHCQRDDEHVEPLSPEPWATKDDQDQDHICYQDQNSCAELENAEERRELGKKINALPTFSAFLSFFHPFQQLLVFQLGLDFLFQLIPAYQQFSVSHWLEM